MLSIGVILIVHCVLAVVHLPQIGQNMRCKMELVSKSAKFVSKINYSGPHQIFSTGSQSQCYTTYLKDKSLSRQAPKEDGDKVKPVK